MRIALVHKRYDRLGGAEGDCYELSHRLAARGHDVRVVVGECRVPVPPGVRVHRVPVVRTGQLAKLLSFAAFAPRVWRALDADAVIGFGRTVGHDLFRASGGCHRRYLARRVAEEGGIAGLVRRLRPYQRALLALERRQYAAGGYRKILTVSARTRDEILATYPQVPPDDVVIVRYGVDVTRFHPSRREREGAAVRRELGIPLEQPVVLCIGTGFRRKGVDHLLAIWSREAPAGAALVVAGNDQHLAGYRRRARAARGLVVFTGPRADVERLYAAADLFTLPSMFDAFGIVVLEALASGLPVVASRDIGAAEVLTGPLAELVVDDPNDESALALRLARGLDPTRRAALGAAARVAAEAASLERAVDAVEHWCAVVAAERGGGR
jgi:UDP-glucose:(heptosyl)LPS alpha-1,3-glucosyltransferase